MRCEILVGSMSYRGRLMMTALLSSGKAAGVLATRTETYKGFEPVLITYGLGDPSRFDAFKRHRAKCGRTVICDMGYWARKSGRNSDCLQRFAIDAMHCDATVFDAPADGSRLQKYGAGAKDFYNPNGPIVLIGQGPKGCTNSGHKLGEWEALALQVIRRRWPDQRVWYRPKVKANGYPNVPGVDHVTADGTIQSVIHGASLVVCQHSNAAIDAIVAGIPVLAEAGAAVAVTGAGLEAEPRIIPISERQRFLEALAWWQWTPDEATDGLVWPFLKERINGSR
jgi:hypothetical protein